jgi:hypothetical protein
MDYACKFVLKERLVTMKQQHVMPVIKDVKTALISKDADSVTPSVMK